MIECPLTCTRCPLRLTFKASTRLYPKLKVVSHHIDYCNLFSCDTDISWIQGDAEELPIATASVDAYTIAFGIRNVTRIPKVTLHGVFIHCLRTTNLSEGFSNFTTFNHRL